MAFNYSPKVVTNGLVLYLDAANPKSYSGSGNTWFDLSGNDNNALKNGNASNPVWNAQGFWDFPASAIGINGGFIINNSNSLSSVSNCTIELCFTLQSKTVISGDSDWMAIFSKGSTRINQTPAISINQAVTNSRFLHIERPSSFNSANNIFTDYTGNKWYYVTAVISSTSFGYLNTQQVSTASGGIIANTNPIYLGLDSEIEMFRGKLSIVKLYNRALSAQEILQNYNATKTRFGL
jgi:hypothetical protein